ncbi:uncharacterized protein YcnI [Paenibacillus sp. DS2015]|uniref:YcnI family copper-binding membrane protein n=1 Tax=Paenibacillus sp. DS2015 TaxID=3373917 RepID=UPI003D1A22DB
MIRKSRLSTMFMTTAAGLLLFSGVASAHVTVKPTTSTPSAWETYSIKIPVEKDIPTTKVTLKIPAEVDFKQYQPVPEWEVSTEKDSAGKIVSITWSATGKGIAAGEFQQFNFVAQNPKQDEEIAWDAFQYYEDGSIVEWTGDKDSDSPHSTTQVTAAPASEEASHDDSHSHNTATEGTGVSDPTVANDSSTTDQEAAPTEATASPLDMAETSTSSNTTLFVISIAALVLSALSLLVAMRKKR